VAKGIARVCGEWLWFASSRVSLSIGNDLMSHNGGEWHRSKNSKESIGNDHIPHWRPDLASVDSIEAAKLT